MIASAEVAQVSKNVPIGGGVRAAISAIVSSQITPGPLGIDDTSPKADAPAAIAVSASSSEAMQQILVFGVAIMEFLKPNP